MPYKLITFYSSTYDRGMRRASLSHAMVSTYFFTHDWTYAVTNSKPKVNDDGI